MTIPLRAHGQKLLEVSGDRELIAKFEALTNKAANRITRKVLGYGAREIRDEIKFQIRPAKTPGHSNQGLKANIGSKLKKGRGTDRFAAVAGVGVGKRAKGRTTVTGPGAAKAARSLGGGPPHFHLNALGSRDRYTGHRTYKTKAGVVRKSTGNATAYRGRMPADDFVGRAYAARGAKAVGEMVEKMRLEIEREAGQT